MAENFDYDLAFSRNIGWVTRDEQAKLRNTRIAIPGMGGVGGSHLLTLSRLGIGGFNIADFDTFEMGNFNRQAGATMSSVGRAKAEVMAEMARDINPDLDLMKLNEPIGPENIEQFLEKVDLVVDSLDFFAFEARALLHEACQQHGIPVIVAGPIGMSVALVTFLPGEMDFESYFQMQGQPPEEQAVRFLIGLCPPLLHRTYLVDPTAVDFANQKGPSTPMACDLCAGVAATEALKILLNRGKVRAAPYTLQFDAYRNKLGLAWRPGGNRNPLQRLAIALARRQFLRLEENPK